MKKITFSPLRVIKKTGKITVASYMQWRKILTADYSKFQLEICNKHKQLDGNAFVFNHKGEQLFFYNYNPAEVPVFQYSKIFDLDAIREQHNQYGILWDSDINHHVGYNMKGTDCDGVPTFSHFTADYIATHYLNVNEFVPLTVDMVNTWYGWFLWQLNNSLLLVKE